MSTEFFEINSTQTLQDIYPRLNNDIFELSIDFKNIGSSFEKLSQILPKVKGMKILSLCFHADLCNKSGFDKLLSNLLNLPSTVRELKMYFQGGFIEPDEELSETFQQFKKL